MEIRFDNEESIVSGKLEQGAVYYFPHPQNDIAHYFILLNKNPTAEDNLYFVCSQSNIEKVQRIRKNASPPTLIIVREGRYQNFSKDSIIDCNSTYTKSIRQLAFFLKIKRLQFKNPPISGDILKQIIAGVKMSRLVEKAIQNII